MPKKLGEWKKLRRLQKLLNKSYANLLKAVRQITQENTGKKTAGVDKEVINTPQQRVKFVNSWEMPEALPTRRVFIPKNNGKKRPLGIPTVRDRVAQCIVKNYLEPEWEAVFETNSYGFRAGRSCHDAIEQIFLRLQKGRDKWLLDADIQGCFDNCNGSQTKTLRLAFQGNFQLTLTANKNTLRLTLSANKLTLIANSSQTRFSAHINCK